MPPPYLFQARDSIQQETMLASDKSRLRAGEVRTVIWVLRIDPQSMRGTCSSGSNWTLKLEASRKLVFDFLGIFTSHSSRIFVVWIRGLVVFLGVLSLSPTTAGRNPQTSPNHRDHQTCFFWQLGFLSPAQKPFPAATAPSPPSPGQRLDREAFLPPHLRRCFSPAPDACWAPSKLVVFPGPSKVRVLH